MAASATSRVCVVPAENPAPRPEQLPCRHAELVKPQTSAVKRHPAFLHVPARLQRRTDQVKSSNFIKFNRQPTCIQTVLYYMYRSISNVISVSLHPQLKQLGSLRNISANSPGIFTKPFTKKVNTSRP
jgi:hypothetical protein